MRDGFLLTLLLVGFGGEPAKTSSGQALTALEMIGPKELQVRLMLMGGDTLVERYQEADAPYICQG